MISRAELKQQARQQMSGKFGALFLCFLAFWGIGFICTKGFNFALMPRMSGFYKNLFDSFMTTSPNLIEDIDADEAMSLSAYSNLGSALSLAYWVLVYPIISVGMSQVLLNLTYGDVPQVSTVFEPYKTRFGKSIGTVWLKKLFEILWAIPFYFITIICFVIMIAVMTRDDSFWSDFIDMFFGERNLGSAIFSVIGIVLLFVVIMCVIIGILLIPYSIVISKYAMAIYIMNEQPGLSSTQCIDESKRIMMGRRWEFFVLKLSFIPWFLLCLIPCIGWLSLAYMIPYMQVTFTNYYHNIKGSLPYSNGDVANAVFDNTTSCI